MNYKKGKLHPLTNHDGPKGEQRYSSTPSSISVLDHWGWLTSFPCRSTPGITRCSLYRSLDEPQGLSGRVRNISLPSGFDPPTVQPVASRYTGYVVPVQLIIIINLFNGLTAESQLPSIKIIKYKKLKKQVINEKSLKMRSFSKFMVILFTTRGTDKSLARPTCRCILFDDENISFDASLVIYTWFVPKVSVLISYLIIYWTYLKLQVISFKV